jgi:hypothetical protein
VEVNDYPAGRPVSISSDRRAAWMERWTCPCSVTDKGVKCDEVRPQLATLGIDRIRVRMSAMNAWGADM